MPGPRARVTFRLLCVLLSTSIAPTVTSTAEVSVEIADTTDSTSSVKITLQVFPEFAREISLVPNRNYEIECIYSASFSDQDGWKKNGSVIPEVADPQSPLANVSVVNEVHTRTLAFNTFTSDLAGLYQCVYPGGVRELQIGVGNPTILLEYTRLVFNDGQVITEGLGVHKPLVSGDPPPTVPIVWYKDGVLQDLPTDGTLILPASASVDTGGNYTAMLSVGNEISVSETLIININILPVVELTVETSQALIGENLTLSCQDKTGVPASYVTWEKDETIISNGTVEGISIISMSTSHSDLVISNSQFSHGGVYKCTAKNDAGSTSKEQLIEIFLSSPSSLSVTVTPLPSPMGYWAGSKVSLTCHVTLSIEEHYAEIVWKREGVVVEGNERITIMSTNESATSYTSQVTIIGISSTSDSGNYICEATAKSGEYTSQPMSSESFPVVVRAPTLGVSVTALSNQVLDTAPYNEVILNCSATAPSDILPDVIYEWFVDNQMLTHGQNGVTISPQGLLHVEADTAGSFVYTCLVRLELFGGDQDVTESMATNVEVKGPAAPYVPINVAVGTILYNSATVQFTITKIRYTKETYHIIYGTSEGQLTMRSDKIDGNADLTVTDEVFTVTLLHLDHSTQYFYRVLAENENSDSASVTDIQSFRTPSLALLQVKAGSFRGCSDGKVSDSSEVSAFMRTTLSSVVEERCNCEFPASNLVNGTLLCSNIDSHDLIYRAYLVSTIELSSPQIISYIEDWIKEAPVVSTGVAVIIFDANCTINITSMLDPICNTTTDTVIPVTGCSIDLLGSDWTILVMVITIALIVFLVLFVVILIIVVVVLQRKLKLSTVARKKIYHTFKRESGASSVNGSYWNGEAHVTNECPAYMTAYRVPAHREGMDMESRPRQPLPEPAWSNTPGIYDSIDHLNQTGKDDLRARIAMAQPPLPDNHRSNKVDIVSMTSSNEYDANEHTGSSNV